MSRFLDTEALRGLLPKLRDLNRRYKALYAEGYELLAAGAALLPKNCPGLWGEPERERLEQKLTRFATRELKRLDKEGTVRRRFISAVSCRGNLTLTDALRADGARLVLLDDALGLGGVYLAGLAAEARERGYDAVLCPDPLEPERTEALLLPEAGLSFLAADPAAVSGLGLPRPWRHLRLDALPAPEALSGRRAELRRRRSDSALLLGRAVLKLAEAKALHDELEALYRPHVDFAGASALTAEHVKALGLPETVS